MGTRRNVPHFLRHGKVWSFTRELNVSWDHPVGLLFPAELRCWKSNATFQN